MSRFMETSTGPDSHDLTAVSFDGLMQMLAVTLADIQVNGRTKANDQAFDAIVGELGARKAALPGAVTEAPRRADRCCRYEPVTEVFYRVYADPEATNEPGLRAFGLIRCTPARPQGCCSVDECEYTQAEAQDECDRLNWDPKAILGEGGKRRQDAWLSAAAQFALEGKTPEAA